MEGRKGREEGKGGRGRGGGGGGGGGGEEGKGGREGGKTGHHKNSQSACIIKNFKRLEFDNKVGEPPSSNFHPLPLGVQGYNGYLDTRCAGEALSVADHTHVICVLFELGVSTGAPEKTGKALLFFLHPAAGVATREGLVTHHPSPLLALRVHTHVANGQQSRVARGATETTRTLSTTCV